VVKWLPAGGNHPSPPMTGRSCWWIPAKSPSRGRDLPPYGAGQNNPVTVGCGAWVRNRGSSELWREVSPCNKTVLGIAYSCRLDDCRGARSPPYLVKVLHAPDRRPDSGWPRRRRLGVGRSSPRHPVLSGLAFRVCALSCCRSSACAGVGRRCTARGCQAVLASRAPLPLLPRGQVRPCGRLTGPGCQRQHPGDRGGSLP